MKLNLLFSLFALLFFVACSAPEEPEFKHMKNFSAKIVSMNSVQVSGISVYHNPNPMGGNLVAMDMEVWVDDISVGQLKKSLSVNVPARGEFELPFEVEFDPKKVFKSEGLLGGVMAILGNRKMNVKYQGTVTMEIMKVNFDVPVDFTEEITLGK